MIICFQSVSHKSKTLCASLAVFEGTMHTPGYWKVIHVLGKISEVSSPCCSSWKEKQTWLKKKIKSEFLIILPSLLASNLQVLQFVKCELISLEQYMHFKRAHACSISNFDIQISKFLTAKACRALGQSATLLNPLLLSFPSLQVKVPRPILGCY